MSLPAEQPVVNIMATKRAVAEDVSTTELRIPSNTFEAPDEGNTASSCRPMTSSINNSPIDLEKGATVIETEPETDIENIVRPEPIPRPGHNSAQSSSSTWRLSVLPDDMQKLPYKRERRGWRHLRHILLAVYQRLFSIVFIANMIAFIILLAVNRHPSLPNLATAASANIMVSILIRQEFVINMLYIVCCWTPVSAPLRIRRMIAKVYHFGGIHSGCGVASVIWFILFCAYVTKAYVRGEMRDAAAVLGITYVLLVLLGAICIFAIPAFRFLSHNSFEAVHRFAGWTALALFWVQIILASNSMRKLVGTDSLGLYLVKFPTFWFLLVASVCIVLPWLRLRKVEAVPEVLSSHAVRLRFKYAKMGLCVGIRISLNPLKEWHAFATIPEPDGSSFSLIVSRAGDWTKDQIENPKSHYWVRGMPTKGVLHMALIFKRVVIVTTGSGIGPCLSLLVARPISCRILWSTPNPITTYGDSIIEEVAKADPEAMIINSRASGRPDMVTLTHHLFVESKAEAVFVISNPAVTKKVVYGMETRGIPAYGPIWDS